MVTTQRRLRAGQLALRALACLAVVPVGLGPSMVAFAQVDTGTDTTTTTTEPTTTTTTTAATPTTTAPAATTTSRHHR